VSYFLDGSDVGFFASEIAVMAAALNENETLKVTYIHDDARQEDLTFIIIDGDLLVSSSSDYSMVRDMISTDTRIRMRNQGVRPD
jgi:hypothetical protein